MEPEIRERLQNAVSDWLGGKYSDKYSFRKVAKIRKIPKSVLLRYTHPDPSKRISLALDEPRKNALLSTNDASLVVDVLRRYGRGNQGEKVSEAAEIIGDFKPELSKKQT